MLNDKGKLFKLVQGPLVAVAAGIIYFISTKGSTQWGISPDLLVSVPVPEDATSFFAQFSFPNFGAISNPEIWIVAFTIALVASLETLLCVEATDKIDPLKVLEITQKNSFLRSF